MSEVFDLDAAAAEATEEPFQFTYHNRRWALAHLSNVDWRMVERADSGQIGAIRECFHAGFGCNHEDEDAGCVVAAVDWDKTPQPISAMTALFNRWLQHSGLRAGESSASPDSSTSTAGPSKRASRRTTRASGSASSSPAS